AGPGAATAGLPRLISGSDLRELAERAAVQRVVRPAALPPIAHEPRVFESLQMEGQAGLRRVEYILQLAHAALAVRQQPHDLEPGLVRECVEHTRSAPNHGNGRRGHRPKYIK